MKRTSINLCHLNESIASANRRFHSIKQKYPHLRAYLVLAIQGSQVEIDSPIYRIINELPEILAEGVVKNTILKLLKEPQPEKQSKAQKKAMEDLLHNLIKVLEFNGKTQIEIRFTNIDYTLVGMLKADELVDQILTSQSKASTRIVLGTLSSM